jgi:threonine dehydrogenase-like Zn-dependent dehydrogenase
MTQKVDVALPAPVVSDPVRTARAVVLHQPDQPVALRSFPFPKPEPGAVVVSVTHAGICGTDLHLQQGHLPIPMPLVLGHEGLGVVHSTAPGADEDALGADLRPGDRVMWASSIACGRCVPCRQLREPTLCLHRRTYGVNRPTGEFPGLSGSWAEAIHLADGSTVVRLPDGVDSAAAMVFACAGPTVVHALVGRRPVRAGEVVVVQGCGPVGLAAAALAQLSGARKVILVGHHESRLRLAALAGIGDVHIAVDPAKPWAQAMEQVRRATPAGAGADLVVEGASTAAAFAQSLDLARRGGSVVSVGQYTDTGTVSVNPHHIVQRQLDISGSWGFSGAHVVDYVGLLPSLTARFDLGCLVTEFPLSEANDALRDLRERRVMKAVLVNGKAHR